ncbi:hypothetical protein ACHIPZ_12665 [Antrihabitans sp. NCIMB 15449]|uniref:Uncharacterized protein n=1 Tax=Antrihabitans spumae TaxID=3373370 RepID=A0ABW7JM56_9NOCA
MSDEPITFADALVAGGHDLDPEHAAVHSGRATELLDWVVRAEPIPEQTQGRLDWLIRQVATDRELGTAALIMICSLGTVALPNLYRALAEHGIDGDDIRAMMAGE